jgi:UDP-GlcNAc:undecaprenyl-phosphate GlcNAc-1-phosphate transferase
VRLLGSLGLPLVAALVLVPLAIRVALRTNFVDCPGGYKGHARPTPYLGGGAVILAIATALPFFGSAAGDLAPLLIWALVLAVVGTVDDKRNLNPLTRLVIEVVAAAALWNYGLGWTVFGNPAADLALTVVWVVGLVNAFNLMDNMDGAASTVAAVCAAGVGLFAAMNGEIGLSAVCLAVTGACLGFLRYNLSRPARIFLGDGGSMPIGFIVAGAVMVSPGTQTFGWSALLAVAPMVGLPILDTTLVVISRRRGHRPILAGGRDHLTHRLRAIVGSAHGVAASLCAVQTALCLSVIGLMQLNHLLAAVGAAMLVAAGGFVIYVLETPGRGRLKTVARALPAESVTPERSAA